MITTAAKPDHRSLPRKKREPSLRDQAIYLAYRVTAKTQTELAQDFGLTQRRVSAIIKRVELWRADPSDPGGQLPPQQQRLDRWIEQQRLQSVYDRALRAFDTQPPELKTKREGDRDGKKFRDETTRQVPPNVQLLKVANRAAEGLIKLNHHPAGPAAASSQAKNSHATASSGPESNGADERFWDALTLLRDLRRDAGIPQDESIFSKDYATLRDALHNLIYVGSPSPPSTADAPAVEPDPTMNVKPETLSNCTNSAPPTDTPANLADPTVTPNPDSTSTNPPPPSAHPLSPPTESPALEPDSPLQRRLRHERKLAQLRYCRQHGLPYLIEFDPADGPIPRIPCQIDDFGYIPSPPPSSAEIREQNEQYLALVRAQNEANNRRLAEP